MQSTFNYLVVKSITAWAKNNRKQLLDENSDTRGRAGEVSRCIKSKVKLTSPKSAGRKKKQLQPKRQRNPKCKNPIRKTLRQKHKGYKAKGRNKDHQENAKPGDKDWGKHTWGRLTRTRWDQSGRGRRSQWRKRTGHGEERNRQDNITKTINRKGKPENPNCNTGNTSNHVRGLNLFVPDHHQMPSLNKQSFKWSCAVIK